MRLALRIVTDNNDRTTASKIAKSILDMLPEYESVSWGAVRPFEEAEGYEIILQLDGVQTNVPLECVNEMTSKMGDGWVIQGDEASGIWNRQPNTRLFDPAIRWAHVTCFDYENT